MVRRLLQAGHGVAAWNRTPSRLRPLLEAGARAAATPADLAKECELILLSLLDTRAAEAVVFGADGIASGHTVEILVDHSTISPTATRLLAARLAQESTCQWIDAPVSGGVAGAVTGTLTVMAGGCSQALAAAAPFIGAYAGRIVHMGAVGAGQATKLCNQTIVAANLFAVAEAVRLASHSGIEPARLPEAFGGGWIDSKALQTLLPRMLAPPVDNIGTIGALLKDIESVAELAHDCCTPMPLMALTQHLLRMAAATDLREADLSRVVEMLGLGERGAGRRD
jgi:2-hydroxy-3-oxopropionate reductase